MSQSMEPDFRSSPTSPRIRYRFLTSGGEPSGDDSQIFSTTDWQGRPAVAYHTLAEEYLLVWQQKASQDDSPFSFDIYGRRVSGEGTLANYPCVISHTLDAQEPTPVIAKHPAVIAKAKAYEY